MNQDSDIDILSRLQVLTNEVYTGFGNVDYNGDDLLHGALNYVLTHEEKHSDYFFLFNLMDRFSESVDVRYINYLLFYSIRENRRHLKGESINRGATINSFDHRNNRLLDYGFGYRNSEQLFDKVNEALELGWDINSRDKYGNTMLESHFRVKRLDVIEFLINNGADPYIENNRGNNIFDRLNNMSGIKGIVALRKFMEKYR